MKATITMVKGWIDDLVHLLMSFVAVGAMSEVLFGSGVFGVNVIGNLTAIIAEFGSYSRVLRWPANSKMEHPDFWLVLLMIIVIFKYWWWEES
jgi:hypothetical protein